VAKRVEEELERRRDEIEAEVRHTLSLPLCLSPFTLLEHMPSCGFIKQFISVKCGHKTHIPAVLRIRKRICFGWVGPDPHLVCVSGSRRAKITHKNRKKFINFCFEVLDVLF
jgi:hypothetical protein